MDACWVSQIHIMGIIMYKLKLNSKWILENKTRRRTQKKEAYIRAAAEDCSSLWGFVIMCVGNVFYYRFCSPCTNIFHFLFVKFGQDHEKRKNAIGTLFTIFSFFRCFFFLFYFYKLFKLGEHELCCAVNAWMILMLDNSLGLLCNRP